MIQIIHISDFHLESDVISAQKQSILDALVIDIKYKIVLPEKAIVVISGDLVDKGGSGFNSIENPFLLFEKLFIDKLSNELNIDKKQFFFVPGNHDVCRNDIDEFAEIGIKSQLKSQEEISKFINSNKISGKNINRVKKYKDFERKYYDDFSEKQLSLFDSNFKLSKLNVGIACLNSSWRCFDDNDKGNLIIGKEQIESALIHIKETEIKIAIAHHPFEYLLEEDKKAIKPLINSSFDILLVGHAHCNDIAFTKDFYGTILCCQSNASIADFSKHKDYQSGYSIINFEKGQRATISYRKYLYEHKKFVSNTDIGNDQGEIVIDYPNLNKIEQDKIIDKVLSTLQEIRCEDVNEHLFVHGTDAKCPCKVNDLFVEPTISNLPETHANIEGITHYSVSDLVKIGDNFLIYGLKESGKTILLDKLMLEFTKYYSIQKQIPVILKFNEIGTKEISQKVRDYIGVSSKEYRDCLTNSKFVLLIDDIEFGEEGKNNLNKLIQFLRDNPSVRIIATKEQILENNLPEDFLDFNADFNFSIAFIQNFKSAHIKSLIQKWFPEKTPDYQNRINKVIKNFEALSLPRTPLSVTLFLWIIDKQENRPINNTILVSQVAENLLEHINIENIYASTFNSANKTRLLSHIAKLMHDHGDANRSYRITYTSLLDFVTTYLNLKFDINPKKVIDDFIKRGILFYNDENYIKFKFAFLYHYFLALHLDNDIDFRNSVLNIDNCLNYIDELEYYSGLHTDSEELLLLSQNLLTQVFSDYNSDIVDKYDKIDPFFDSKDSLSERMNIDKVKKKPTEQELEKLYDEQIQNIPIKRDIAKRSEGSAKPIDKTLKLASLIFRNTEEINDSSKRLLSLKNIIRSSISYLILYRDSLIRYYIKNQKEPAGLPPNINFGFFIRILPLLHQLLMSEWIGTDKTKLIIGEKIKEDKLNLSISEFEKFLTIFIFSDIKGKEYKDVVKSYLKQTKWKYIKDFGIIKLILYYYMRSKDKETDKYYLNLISDLKINMKQIKDKSKFINKLEKSKNEELRKKE
jgi:predicted MPP superfamily phosphohydrolase